MGWQDQGRQDHGWFGHGAGPGQDATPGPDPAVAGKSHSERSLAIAYGSVAALPAAQRQRVELQYDRGTRDHLTEAMTAWMRGTRLDRVRFASLFFGRSVDDPIVQALQLAALAGGSATSQAELRAASEGVAKAIQLVGLDRWSRFVADALERANDPATVAAVKESQFDPSRSQAIRPVYPVETVFGIGVAAVKGGIGVAARVVGGAILKQVLPDSRSLPSNAPAVGDTAGTKPPASTAPVSKQGGTNAPATPAAAQRPSISRQKQDGHISGTPQNQNRIKQGKLTSTFDGSPAEADALTQEAWQKGTPGGKDPNVRDYDFGRRIGTGGFGDGQSSVRVHQDLAGRIHGYPEGLETP